MAGRGPAPKKGHQRERDTARRTATQFEMVEDDEVRGPDLPGGIDWPVVTLTWWNTWRNSSQAASFTETDWDFLVDTALLHARFWKGDEKVAGELRLRVAKFGATPEDRARLRMQVGEPGEQRAGVKADDAGNDPYSGLRVS